MGRIKIKGRIIRIIDSTSVIVNLGSAHGISSSSKFYVLGEPEPVTDPDTNEELGTVTVTKVVLKASQVFERFTIAVSKWSETTLKGSVASLLFEPFAKDQFVTNSYGDELNVKDEDIKPWLSKSEIPVQVGDEAEVEVDLIDESADVELSGVVDPGKIAKIDEVER